MVGAIRRWICRWLTRERIGFEGLFLWLRTERSLFLLWLVILLVALLRGSSDLHIWVILILGTCLMVAEMLNTAIERLCNLINPGFSEEVRVIKDICAAAVLVSGLALVVVGSWIIAVS
jgi:diacylglycerol kinase